jgi:cellulose synthase/poly-beta-1,6-N-acetylglucosamine synthase-like glycosyltransferase
LLVDDRSTDGSGALLRTLAVSDPRIRIVAGPGQGIVAALQAGLQESDAPLVARMDADDVWMPGRLALQRALLQSDPTLAAVGGRVELFTDGLLSPGMQHYGTWLNSLITPEQIHRERYVESPLVHPATLLRRAALERVGGYRQGPFPEDYELWLRLLSAGLRLASVDAVVLRWRDGPERLTRRDGRYALTAHHALKAEYLAREPFAAGGVRIAGAGPTGLRLARLLKARGVKIVGFIDVHPRKQGILLEGARVQGYDALGAPDGVMLLVAVGKRGVRDEVRAFITPRGWQEGRDFLCVS